MFRIIEVRNQRAVLLGVGVVAENEDWLARGINGKFCDFRIVLM